MRRTKIAVVLTAALLLALALGLAACGSSDSDGDGDETPSAETATTTHDNDEYGFSIAYPSDYKEVPVEFGSSSADAPAFSVGFGDPDGKIIDETAVGGLQVSVYRLNSKVPPESVPDLQEDFQDLGDSLLPGLEDSKVLDPLGPGGAQRCPGIRVQPHVQDGRHRDPRNDVLLGEETVPVRGDRPGEHGQVGRGLAGAGIGIDVVHGGLSRPEHPPTRRPREEILSRAIVGAVRRRRSADTLGGACYDAGDPSVSAGEDGDDVPGVAGGACSGGAGIGSVPRGAASRPAAGYAAAAGAPTLSTTADGSSAPSPVATKYIASTAAISHGYTTTCENGTNDTTIAISPSTRSTAKVFQKPC